MFGIVFSVILSNMTKRYRPEVTCSILAEEQTDHMVIIGYNNLAKRIRALLAKLNFPVVVVDLNPVVLENLIREEQPVIIGDAKHESILRAAGVHRARIVIIATDDLNTLALCSQEIRSMNPKCHLLLRCSDSELGQVLARVYNASSVSVSKLAADYILQKAQEMQARYVVVLGLNTLGYALHSSLEASNIETVLCDDKDSSLSFADARYTDSLLVPPSSTGSPAPLAEAQSSRDITPEIRPFNASRISDAQLVVLANDNLGKSLVRVDRIRSLNPHCTILCRIFQDDISTVLTQEPFRCQVLSTSRLALEHLVNTGSLDAIGIKINEILAHSTSTML